MMLRSCLFSLLLLASLPTGANAQFSNGYISIHADPQGTTCQANEVAFQPLNLYIVMHLQGQTSGGITSAVFRMDPLPTEWFHNSTPSPSANIAIGDPLGDGVAVAFPVCQNSPDRSVFLYSILVFPTTTVGGLILSIQPSITPLPGLLVTLCDGPVFTQVPVGCGMFFINFPFCQCCINRSVAMGGCDAVGVSPAAWSAVKELYR